MQQHHIISTINIIVFSMIFIQNAEAVEPDKFENLLRVATYNILFQNNKAEEISSLIIRNKSDIILILEYNGHNIEPNSLRKAGYNIYIDHPRFHPGGIALIAHKSIHLEGSLLQSPVEGSCAMPLVVARIQRDDSTYALIGIHAPPPFHRCKNQTYSLLTTVAGWIYKGKLIHDVGKAKKGDTVILLGDFNIASFNPVLEVFNSAGLKDVYAEHHYFSTGTWSPVRWGLPLLRIDFIYMSNSLETSNAWHVEIPGSDHYGVLADILIEGNL